jgi:hypothetical protein
VLLNSCYWIIVKSHLLRIAVLRALQISVSVLNIKA